MILLSKLGKYIYDVDNDDDSYSYYGYDSKYEFHTTMSVFWFITLWMQLIIYFIKLFLFVNKWIYNNINENR
jgi:hypothetical protein